MKAIKGYKTILFNAATLAVTSAGFILQYMDQIGLQDRTFALSAIGLNIFVAVVNLYLRSVTTTPVGQKY